MIILKKGNNDIVTWAKCGHFGCRGSEYLGKLYRKRMNVGKNLEGTYVRQKMNGRNLSRKLLQGQIKRKKTRTKSEGIA